MVKAIWMIGKPYRLFRARMAAKVLPAYITVEHTFTRIGEHTKMINIDAGMTPAELNKILRGGRGRPIEKPIKVTAKMEFTEAEHESLQEQAAAHGLTLDEFLEEVAARRA